MINPRHGRLVVRRCPVLATGTRERMAAHLPRRVRDGVEPRLVAEALESSDPEFIERACPAVQVFTEPHGYHRPSDTPEKLTARAREGGRVRAREASSTGRPARDAHEHDRRREAEPGRRRGPPAAGGGRRVTIGTMPDFAFAGPGKVAGCDARPRRADKAAPAKDVLVKLNGGRRFPPT